MRYYYPPDSPIDLDSPSGYTPPAYTAVDLDLPYRAPHPTAVNLDSPSGYTVPPYTAVDFGGAVTPIPATDLSVSISAPAAEIQIVLEALPPVSEIGVSITGPEATLQVAIAWGQVVPGAGLPGASRAIAWNDALSKPRELVMRHQSAERIDSTIGSGWDVVQEQDCQTEAPHNQMTTLDGCDCMPWGVFDTADQNSQQRYTQPPALDQQQAQPWDAFGHTPSAESEYPYIYPPAVDSEQAEAWFSTELFKPRAHWEPPPEPEPRPEPEPQPIPPGSYTAPAYTSADLDCLSGYQPPQFDYYDEWTDRGKWRRFYRVAVNFGSLQWEEWQPTPVDWPPEPVEANRPSDSSLTAAHDQMQHHDQANRVPWGAGSWTRPYPDYGPDIPWPNEPDEVAPRPPQPAIHEVYLFMPSITLYRLPDGAEIEATNVTWSTDSDSWGWRFSATLKHEQHLALVKPTSNGYTEIGCEISGHQFTALVEGYDRRRQVGNTGFTINGHSRTVLLSDPHAPARSKLITAPYSAAALAGQELANTGFTLEWNATDWLIPGGAYSYENLSPISAIKQLAEAAGYMLQSHPADKTLIVSPRYRVSPHKWTDPTTSLDAILPIDLVTQDGSSFTSRPAYNRAIVAGEAEGGVIVTVTRDGTAGDILAPMDTNKLITHKDAGYEHCRNLIAAGGIWEKMNLTTMLTLHGEAPGLILPGHLVEVQDVTETYPVRIDGTTITAQMNDKEIKVRQQLVAERRIE